MAQGQYHRILDWRATGVLNDAIVEILDKYYAPKTKVVNIFTHTVNKENQHEVDKAISYIMEKMNERLHYQLFPILSETPMEHIMEIKSTFFISIVDGRESWK